jgi:predicted phosphodiesterase
MYLVPKYGLTPRELRNEQEGALRQFTADSHYDYYNATSSWVGTLHTARMTGLLPSHTYHYRVGDGDSLWSETFSFTSQAAQLDDDEKVSFAVIGDMDFGEASDATVASLQRLVDAGSIAAVVHSGDISYADGYEPHFDAFFNKMQPIAARVPYMAVAGNHEFWFNFTSFKNRFYMPGVVDEGGSGDSMYYSWTMGHTHFLSCNSETAIDTANFSPSQLKWMVKDLKTVNRKRTPWVVANFHRPMYCNDNDKTCVRQANVLKTEAERIFYENEVDAVITGHVHAYERTWPVYEEQKLAGDYVSSPYVAPTHFMQGSSGNREGNKGSYPAPEDLPAWSATALTQVGYAVMTVSATELDWAFYEASLNGPDQLLDHVTLTR